MRGCMGQHSIGEYYNSHFFLLFGIGLLIYAVIIWKNNVFCVSFCSVTVVSDFGQQSENHAETEWNGIHQDVKQKIFFFYRKIIGSK